MLNPLRKEKVTTEEYDRDALDEVIRKELRKGVEQLDLPLRAHDRFFGWLEAEEQKKQKANRGFLWRLADGIRNLFYKKM
ncbi:MAG: hypothetical protein J6M47_04490 [Clostridia bacterium]|nr:hypothetical protein [Clostridia bacterium]